MTARVAPTVEALGNLKNSPRSNSPEEFRHRLERGEA